MYKIAAETLHCNLYIYKYSFPSKNYKIVKCEKSKIAREQIRLLFKGLWNGGHFLAILTKQKRSPKKVQFSKGDTAKQ